MTLPLPSWPEVVSAIQAALRSHLTAPQRGVLDWWLDKLGHSFDGRRLGISVAIDLTCGAVRAADYAKVIAALSDLDAHCGSAFENALLEASGGYADLLVASAHRTPYPYAEGYARVLTLEAFMEYYAQTAEHTYTLADLDEVRAAFFEPDGSSLEDVTAWWTGRKPCVWVAPLEVLTTILAESPEPGTDANDVLGLNVGKGTAGGQRPELVAVTYPTPFDRAPCAQPTALDASWWDPGYYVSYYRKDGWGRTCSCSGQAAGCRERVHREFEGLGEGFRTLYIGPVRPADDAPAEVLAEAYGRYAVALVDP